MALLDPAAATGSEFTVMVTLFDKLQPVAVIVSVKVYIVVTVGFTVELDEVEVNPDGLLVQEYVFPVTAVLPIVVLLPIHIAVFDPAFAAGAGFKLYDADEVSLFGKLSFIPFGFIAQTFSLAELPLKL
jgi:hypothetical protein